MVSFAVAVLIAVHGIAVENPALDFSGFRVTFDSDRICKLTATIRENHLEERRKELIAKLASQCPKDSGHGRSRVTIPEIHQLQIAVLEQDRKQNIATFSADDAVHLADCYPAFYLAPKHI